MKKIGILLGVGNMLGASSTFIYFRIIQPFVKQNPVIPDYYDLLFFFAGMATLSLLAFVLLKRKSSRSLYEVADGSRDISEFDPFMIYHLQRRAIQYPMVVTMASFLIWIVGGFIFGFLEPLITAKIFNVATQDLVFCFRRFLGIILLGGGVTCMVLFFVLENVWRSHIPKFFPEGHLNRVKHVFKISVRKRFLVVMLGIILIPFPIIATTIVSNIQQLSLADAVTRSQLISSLYWELFFLSMDSLTIALILAYFLAKSISTPLLQIKKTIKAVENNDLDARVEIVSNDELGDVAQGINDMIRSLNESQRVKKSFGRYMGKEIRDEIMSGKISLEGEMKRVTLLFSDLRNFTGLVEKNHPRQVVKILNQYFNEMTPAVKEHRGLILQYVGDEIEAVFGAPVGFDDHPEMAVQAALEMRKRLIKLNIILEQRKYSG
ncbi:MAG: HAMP domain-containing protein [Desulfobacteraceae bacterium]|nr:HAMP domain-containing protein [Desulfobacteraceae bacterium]